MKAKPKKYRSKLTLHPMSFEQVVDTILKYRPTKQKKKRRKIKT
jgi:hypothetical protein